MIEGAIGVMERERSLLRRLFTKNTQEMDKVLQSSEIDKGMGLSYLRQLDDKADRMVLKD